MEEKTLLEELRDIVREALQEGPAEDRAQAFAACWTAETKRLVEATGAPASAAMTIMLMSVIHTCNRHPEWMRAVCNDSMWFLENGDEKQGEDALLELCEMYPLPVVRG